MRKPIYDGDSIKKVREEMDIVQIIVDLLVYSESLEKVVIELRKEVNKLTPEGKPIPYAELHSDVYEAFDDYPAYQKYQKYIELFFKY